MALTNSKAILFPRPAKTFITSLNWSSVKMFTALGCKSDLILVNWKSSPSKALMSLEASELRIENANLTHYPQPNSVVLTSG